LCRFSTSNTKGKRTSHRLSPETFGYTLVHLAQGRVWGW